MDKERTILTIQVYKDNNNAFKISSSENISYSKLKQKSIEKFKIPEDEIKYMTFSYIDNEGFRNYINENDILGNLAEEITSGNLLLKLNCEINLYESRKSNINNSVIFNKTKSISTTEDNYQNEKKKLDKELYDSKINQLNLIIQEKDKEILKLKNEIEKLKNQKKLTKNNDPKILTKNNDSAFSKEKENDSLNIKNQILKLEYVLKSEMDTFRNKFENSIIELNQSLKIIESDKNKNAIFFGNNFQTLFTADDIKQYINELMDKISKNQKLFESKIENKFENIQEPSKYNTQIFGELKYIGELVDKIDKNQKLFENKIENKFENIQEFSKPNFQIFENLVDKKSKEIINGTNENINNQFRKIEEDITNNMLKIERLDEKFEVNLNNINDSNKENKIYANENIINENKIMNSDIYNNLDDKICKDNKSQKKSKKQKKSEYLEHNLDSRFDSHNIEINCGINKKNFIETAKYNKKTIKKEIDDFLNNFFFEKEITVSKKEITNENLNKFFEANTKLKKMENKSINDILKDYYNLQLSYFKDKNNCNFDAINIRNQFKERCESLKKKFDEANILINKFRSQYNLSEKDYTDEYLNLLLNNSNGNVEEAFAKIKDNIVQ